MQLNQLNATTCILIRITQSVFHELYLQWCICLGDNVCINREQDSSTNLIIKLPLIRCLTYTTEVYQYFVQISKVQN